MVAEESVIMGDPAQLAALAQVPEQATAGQACIHHAPNRTSMTEGTPFTMPTTSAADQQIARDQDLAAARRLGFSRLTADTQRRIMAEALPEQVLELLAANPKYRADDWVGVNSPRYPGRWQVVKVNPTRCRLTPEGGGGGLNAPHDMICAAPASPDERPAAMTARTMPAPAEHAPLSVLNRTGQGIRTVTVCSCEWVPSPQAVDAAGATTMDDAHAAHRDAEGMPPADYSTTVFGEGPWAGMTWNAWYAQHGSDGHLDPYTGARREW